MMKQMMSRSELEREFVKLTLLHTQSTSFASSMESLNAFFVNECEFHLVANNIYSFDRQELVALVDI